MDPQASWDQLLTALADGNWDHIEELATALLAWLDRDGFPPIVLGQDGLGAEFESALCRAGCAYALDLLHGRWSDAGSGKEVDHAR